MKTKKPKLTRAQLEQKLMEAEACQVHRAHFASANLHRASTDKLMGSGVMVRLSFLGGAEVCSPFVVKDGLSNITLEALNEDLKRSFELSTTYKPKEKL